MKKESLKPESKKSISLLNPNWELVPQESSPSLFMESPGNTSTHFELFIGTVSFYGVFVSRRLCQYCSSACMQEL